MPDIDTTAPRRAWIALRIGIATFVSGTILMSGSHLVLAWFIDALLIEGRDIPDSEQIGVMIDAATMSAVVLFFGGFLLSAVSYGFFYFRAMTLARQLEPEHATVSAHGMWWWYAVPFANLWKPFEGVMQVWRALRTHAGLDPAVPWVFGLWWAVWVGGSFVVNIVDRVHPGADIDSAMHTVPADAVSYLQWSALITPVCLVSAIALWWISARIYAAHSAAPVIAASEPVPGDAQPAV